MLAGIMRPAIVLPPNVRYDTEITGALGILHYDVREIRRKNIHLGAHCAFRLPLAQYVLGIRPLSILANHFRGFLVYSFCILFACYYAARCALVGCRVQSGVK